MNAMTARALRAGRVRDVMQMQMVTVVPEMTVRELAQTLLDSGIRSAPVLDPAGKVLGVATQADVTRVAFGASPPRVPAGDGDPVPEEDGRTAARADVLRVRDVMGPVGVTVGSDESLAEVVRRFLRGRVNQLLVVDHGMLLGIVTPVDVLGAIEHVL
jgi:predicted transcriptional regulator